MTVMLQSIKLSYAVDRPPSDSALTWAHVACESIRFSFALRRWGRFEARAHVQCAFVF